MAEPLLGHGMPAFSMVRLAEDNCLLLEALRSGAIEPGDTAVFWTVLQHLNWRSGRCWASLERLAAALGADVAQVEAAVDRLVDAGLVVVGHHLRETRRHYLAVHPMVCTTGGPYRRRWQWLQFHRHAPNPSRIEEQAAAVGAAGAVMRG
jgi:hypothetical protein